MLRIKQKDNNMKLMHIVFSLDTGGLEKLVVELAKRINHARFTSSVCCLTNEGKISGELTKQGIKVFYCNKKEGLDYLLPFRLARLLKAQDIDIVHTHDNSTVLYGTIASKLAGVKSIINTEHGGVYFETKRKQIMNKFLWLLNDTVVCVSNNVKDDLKKMGLFNGKVKVIPNGIDFDKFDIYTDIQIKRKELGLDIGDFVICALGRLSWEKNQRLLIETSKHILEKIPQAKFLIVGNGPLREYLEQYARQLQVFDKVKFLGEREDIPQILKISNCFVLCSYYESFGLVILEAMAAGIPVVATDVGGVKEIVKDSETGILIPQGDIEMLTRAILQIKNNSAFSDKLILKAKEWIKNNYSIEKMILNYERLYLNFYNNYFSES